MTVWLSDEWAKQAAGFTDLLPEVPGANATVSLAVTGPAKREVSLHWRYADGHPSGGGGGAVDDADLALVMASDDATQVLSGAVEPSVAFMRGRLKAAGDGALLLGFLASTSTAEYDVWRKRVAGLADETG